VPAKIGTPRRGLGSPEDGIDPTLAELDIDAVARRGREVSGR
jgi:hypothetical protein